MKNKQAKKPSKNHEKLLAVARELFVANGYAQTGTEEIVKAAGVTRGALYYQFEDKKALFRATFEQLIAELGKEIFTKTMDVVVHDREDLEVGTQFMLDAFSRKDIMQIMLIDGPNVLGWEQWRIIQQPLHSALLGHALQHLVDEDIIEPQPLEPLSDVIAGAIMHAGLAIANSENPAKTRQLYGASILQILSRLTKTI